MKIPFWCLMLAGIVALVCGIVVNPYAIARVPYAGVDAGDAGWGGISLAGGCGNKGKPSQGFRAGLPERRERVDFDNGIQPDA